MVNDELRKAARQMAARAYCPYSEFRVGAALVTESGAIHAGCNVENGSYGLTCCAERNALFSAVAAGVRPREVVAMAVYTPGEQAHASCGACRQVLSELAPAATVTSFCDGEAVLRMTVAELLPGAFELPGG